MAARICHPQIRLSICAAVIRQVKSIILLTGFQSPLFVSYYLSYLPSEMTRSALNVHRQSNITHTQSETRPRLITRVRARPGVGNHFT